MRSESTEQGPADHKTFFTSPSRIRRPRGLAPKTIVAASVVASPKAFAVSSTPVDYQSDQMRNVHAFSPVTGMTEKRT
jgi:hypothetical protein